MLWACLCLRLIENLRRGCSIVLWSHSDVLSWSTYKPPPFVITPLLSAQELQNCNMKAQTCTYAEAHDVDISYANTHEHLHAHTCCAGSHSIKCFIHSFFFMRGGGGGSLERSEPVINYWLQWYLWDVQMPVLMCHFAVMCVDGGSLSAPAPLILSQVCHVIC